MGGKASSLKSAKVPKEDMIEFQGKFYTMKEAAEKTAKIRMSALKIQDNTEHSEVSSELGQNESPQKESIGQSSGDNSPYKRRLSNIPQLVEKRFLPPLPTHHTRSSTLDPTFMRN